jgi:ATP-dependent Clp protease protease subunit
MWTYNGFSKLQLDLLSQRVVDIAGEVDMDMAKYVREALLRLKAERSPDIEVRITSNGGSVEAGLDIHDMIRLYEGKKKGIVFGMAASMGAVILQACDERCAAPNASVLIHHISRNQVSLDDLRKPHKVNQIRKEMERRQQRLYTILSARTGQTNKRIRAVCAKDEEMLSEEALKFGLIDTVL